MLFDVKLFGKLVATYGKELDEFIKSFDKKVVETVNRVSDDKLVAVDQVDNVPNAFAKAKIGERFSIQFPRDLYFYAYSSRSEGEEVLVISKNDVLHYRGRTTKRFVSFHMDLSIKLTTMISSLSDIIDETIDDTLSELLGVPVRVPKRRVMTTSRQAVEKITNDATLASLFYKGILKKDAKPIIDVFKALDPKVGWVEIGDDEFFVYPFSDEIGDGRKRYPISKLM